MSEYTSFVDGCKNRLIDFYQKRKCIFGGTFRGKEYKHILANKDDRMKLIICKRLQMLGTCARLFGGRVRFHACSHHVNSSQMACINIFGPLLLGDPNKLREFLREAGIIITGNILLCKNYRQGSQFEYRPPTGGDRTNFDCYILTDAEEEVFIEVKYTESEFGRPSAGAMKANEWDFYSKMCKESMNLINLGNDKSAFYNDFQINRNIGHVVSSKQHCVFMFPQANPKLKFQLQPEWKNIHVIHMESIQALAEKAFGTDSCLSMYYRSLKEIYLG